MIALLAYTVPVPADDHSSSVGMWILGVAIVIAINVAINYRWLSAKFADREQRRPDAFDRAVISPKPTASPAANHWAGAEQRRQDALERAVISPRFTSPPPTNRMTVEPCDPGTHVDDRKGYCGVCGTQLYRR